MQRIANQSLRDGLHSYERRHGWKGNLPRPARQFGKLENLRGRGLAPGDQREATSPDLSFR